MERLSQALRLLWGHKGKFFLTLFSAVAFALVLFPFGDLSDLVSAQVSKMTRNQVYLQFEKMRLSLFPEPGMALEGLHVETSGLPAIKANEVIVMPALSMLITQKPAGSASAKGFLRGDVDISLKSGGKSDNGVERQKIVVNAKKLSLAELQELLQLPVPLRGNADLNSTALADFTLKEQPDVDISLKVDRFELPSSNVQTMMGPLTLPELKLSSVELKGRLSAGKFLIENGVIGKESDEVHGTIKGNMAFNLQRHDDGSVTPIFGGYSFDVDLRVKKSFQDRASILLIMIDNQKIPTADGAQYRFKVSATNPLMPPSIGALR